MKGPARVPAKLVVGGAITLAFLGAALIAQFWTPSSPTRLAIADKLKPPLASGLLGTDQLGRDILSLLMVGTTNSLSIALSSVILGAAIGTLIGLLAAPRRGLFDEVAMRAMDLIFAFPPIVSAMMLAATLGPGRTTAIAAIGTFMVPVFARLVRSAARRILTRDYVLAARAAGKGDIRIAAEHVLPNIASDIVVQATIQLGLAVLTEAGLSFLGLGLAPPAPSWGRMLADSITYVTTAPWIAIVPGVTIALAVLGLNLMGDALSDLADPRRGAMR